MNIIEVVKSRKRFRQKGTSSWTKCWDSDGQFWAVFQDGESFVSNDWEVEEKKVTIGKSDLAAALNTPNGLCSHTHTKFLLDFIAKQLGLDE
jgi:hypothetical protein